MTAPHRAATPIETLISGLAPETASHDVVAAVDSLRVAIRAAAATDGPFLSVVLRTQGTRIEPLRQALSSLATQSSDDFEVLLMVHSDAAHAAADVDALVAELPTALAGRIRVEIVTGGNRAVPLNAGIARARGRRIAVLDDDDLVLPEWVRAFADAEGEAAGRLLRARVGTQDVAVDGEVTTPSAIRDEYPRAYDALRQLQVNASPFMGWAFPRALFRGFGVRFDEGIELLEDWDLVLRASALLGVHEIPRITAVYRRWSTADSSMATRSAADWSAAERVVIGRLDSTPLLLDAGAVARIRGLLADSDALRALTSSRSWLLAARLQRIAGAVRRVLPGRAGRNGGPDR